MSEKTRSDFEADLRAKCIADGEGAEYAELVLRRNDAGQYPTVWVQCRWEGWLSSRRQALEEAAEIAEAATARTRRVRAMCNTEPIKPCAIAAAIRREAEGK